MGTLLININYLIKGRYDNGILKEEWKYQVIIQNDTKEEILVEYKNYECEIDPILEFYDDFNEDIN